MRLAQLSKLRKGKKKNFSVHRHLAPREVRNNSILSERKKGGKKGYNGYPSASQQAWCQCRNWMLTRFCWISVGSSRTLFHLCSSSSSPNRQRGDRYSLVLECDKTGPRSPPHCGRCWYITWMRAWLTSMGICRRHSVSNLVRSRCSGKLHFIWLYLTNFDLMRVFSFCHVMGPAQWCFHSGFVTWIGCELS